MAQSHDERNRLILTRTLSAVSLLYAAYDLFFGWSLFLIAPKGEGIHGSRAIGWISLALAALLAGAGGALWKPRRGAWPMTLGAALGTLSLAALDFLGRRPASGAIDGAYGLLALGLFLLLRRRP
jgi:hypothetical protein